MKIRQLMGHEIVIAGGANVAVEITAADLTETTVNTAQTIELFPVKLGTRVELVGAFLKTPFKDASDSALNTTTLIVGDGADTDRLLASMELNENGSEVLAKVGAGAYAYVGADTVDAVFGSMALKNLADVDVGEVVLYFKQTELSALED